MLRTVLARSVCLSHEKRLCGCVLTARRSRGFAFASLSSSSHCFVALALAFIPSRRISPAHPPSTPAMKFSLAALATLLASSSLVAGAPFARRDVSSTPNFTGKLVEPSPDGATVALSEPFSFAFDGSVRPSFLSPRSPASLTSSRRHADPLRPSLPRIPPLHRHRLLQPSQHLRARRRYRCQEPRRRRTWRLAQHDCEAESVHLGAGAVLLHHYRAPGRRLHFPWTRLPRPDLQRLAHCH
ncbi:hypothetical protein AAT19DRAFT_12333 [Rhodotorula toruloides]|uniref:Uncharacterized protein n=1 Tax=Rhodotorula toruloides TaxID=5286 RepID=A0A2T0AFZ6_RHOTO|nr:hypothetical protein AAT19DRAFT_12333 [Rhodotorula toruloides]